MDLSRMTPEERAKIDMCTCGHSRAEHTDLTIADDGGGACRECVLTRDSCGRFTWSHFDTPKEDE